MYAGIVVHKKTCIVCIKNKKGETIADVKIKNNKNGFRNLLKLLKDKKAKAVLGFSSNFWIGVFIKLQTAGVACVLCDFSTTAEADTRNAHALADALRTKSFTVCEPDMLKVHNLITYRADMLEEQLRVVNRTRSLLDDYGLLEKGVNLFKKEGVAWLTRQIPEAPKGIQFILKTELKIIKEYRDLIKNIEQDIKKAAAVEYN